VDRPGLYFAVVVIALVAALWLMLHILGFLFKLIFFVLIVLVGLAAYRAWRGAPPRPG
jgi:hypothetical protein